MSREKTEEEVRDEFLRHIRGLVKYWEEIDNRPSKEKLEGLAFSILAALDGCSVDLPSFIVAPLPTKEDKQYHMKNGSKVKAFKVYPEGGGLTVYPPHGESGYYYLSSNEYVKAELVPSENDK